MGWMTSQPKFLAIIPARGGSKGLPGKNILQIGGMPLISWTINASLGSKYIHKTYVSSESKDILDIAKGWGAEVIERPQTLACDDTPSEPVIEHVVETLSHEGYDYIVFLQPTSPARSASDIDNAIEQLLSTEATSSISVFEPKHTLFKAFKLKSDGFITGLVDEKSSFMRRQDLAKTYMPNGAIYIVKLSAFQDNKSLLTDKCIPYVMDEDNSIDIDNMEDVKLFETFLMRNNVENS